MNENQAPQDIPFEEPVPCEEGGLDILAVLEAMLFVSPEPLSLVDIQAALPELPRHAIEVGLEALARALEKPGRGLRLEPVAGGYRLVSQPALAGPLQALFRHRNRKRLTPATLDVLAIVAYAQPITAPEIQEIRGTDPSYALRVLGERKLVRIVGRKRVVGRPILYGTSKDFLVHFGLDSLEDLPAVEAYGTRVVPAQARLFPVGDGGVEPLEEEDAAAEQERLAQVEPGSADEREESTGESSGGTSGEATSSEEAAPESTAELASEPALAESAVETAPEVVAADDDAPAEAAPAGEDDARAEESRDGE